MIMMITPDDVLAFVQQYGYIAIFALFMFGIIGVPLPEETVLAIAGYLVSEGHLKLFPTYAAAWIGTTCGITVSYFIGRYVGVGFLKRYGRFVRITDERIERVHNWFERRGRWSLTVAYFVPGVRHIFAIVAGSSKVRLPVFALFAYSGGLVWSVSFITLGYAGGKAWRRIVAEENTIVLIAGAVAIVAGAAYLAYKRLRKAPK